VLIRTANKLESHHKYQIQNQSWATWLTNLEKFNLKFDYTWNKKHIFGCFYGRPTAARLGIATHLAKNYAADSLILIKFEFDNDESRKLFDIGRLFYWHPEIVQQLQILNDSRYYSNKHYQRGAYSFDNSLSELYQNILIDVVAEPVCEGISFYPTEKISRAILCKKPFIVMSSRYYMHYLRQLGFQTFDLWWDESYDCYDSNIRYHKILNLIDNIHSNKYQIELYYHQMKSVLDHNYNLLTSNRFKKVVERIKDSFEHV
jgi:hypothetical protein